MTECDTQLRIAPTLLSHFPCSLSCSESLADGEKLFAHLCDFDRGEAEQLRSLLCLPLLLRHEVAPPPHRRLGVHGAILMGCHLGTTVYYAGWRSLKSADALEDAALDRGSIIVDERSHYTLYKPEFYGGHAPS